MIGLVAVAALPIVGHWVRASRADRCAFDGMKIQPVFRVRVLNRAAADQFCCVRCAELWLERQQTPPTAVYVTDEVTGRDVDSSRAHFVRSSVITMPHTKSRVHTFENKSDAEKHAGAFKGKVLMNTERPLQLRRARTE
ncbi:MAG: hypothetical protein IAG10_28420 [Planctomycetaceae bacterium]|nr:hypothetical protein [Planctomycetaceae bacterium]